MDWAEGKADADRERAAGADGGVGRGHARAGAGEGLRAGRAGQVRGRAIRWANIRRWRRPAPSRWPIRRGC